MDGCRLSWPGPQLNIWEGFLEEEAKSALDSQILSASRAASEAEGGLAWAHLGPGPAAGRPEPGVWGLGTGEWAQLGLL